MKVCVHISVTDWDNDEVVLAERTERIPLGEGDPWTRTSVLMVELIDDCSHRAATQAMALAEDVAARAEGQDG